MAKKQITIILDDHYEFDGGSINEFDGGSIKGIIKYLQNTLDSHCEYKNLRLELYHDWDAPVGYYLKGDRLETDKEYELRKLQDKKDKKRESDRIERMKEDIIKKGKRLGLKIVE